MVASGCAAIWHADADGKWRPLTASGYPTETALHDLVEQTPQLLPLAGTPQITVLGREVQLGTGRADLIAVESSGRLVIVEVKLADNSEARRAVVAQVLSYAAYLQGLQPGQLEATVLAGHLAARGCTTVLGAVEAMTSSTPSIRRRSPTHLPSAYATVASDSSWCSTTPRTN